MVTVFEERCYTVVVLIVFFFQAEDGIRDLVRSRGLGDVYKRQQMKKRVRTIPRNEILQPLIHQVAQ